MGAFGGMILTNKGRNLQAKVQTGIQLNFTRLAVGDGELGGSSILELNSLKHQVKTLGITKLKTMSGGKVAIGTVLSNQGIISGFYFREIGVFAQDPDIGEILYCYANCGATAEYIPAGGGPDIIEKAIDIITIIGSEANVTASIDNSLIHPTVADLRDVTDGASGADLIGVTPIDGLIGSTVQGLLEAIALALSADKTNLTTHKTSDDHDGRYYTKNETGLTTEGASGASKVGVSPISGVTGNTVQAVLVNLLSLLTNHKSSTDHDSRYYTETELGATIDGAAGADKIGATGVSGLTGTTVQSLIESLKSFVDNISTALNNHKSSTDHDGRYYTESELGATTDNSSGANKIGATPITGVTGTNVQVILESLKTLLDGKAPSAHNHDGTYYKETEWSTVKGINGYIKFPNGIIIQWGRGTTGAQSLESGVYYASALVTLPIAFPNANLATIGSVNSSALISPSFSGPPAGSKTQVGIYVCAPTSGLVNAQSVNYIAIGY